MTAPPSAHRELFLSPVSPLPHAHDRALQAPRNRTVSAFGLGRSLRLLLELGGERDVVKEGPGVVELVIPGPLEVVHGLHHAVQLLVAHQGQQGGIDARRACGTRRIFFGRICEDTLGLARSWSVSAHEGQMLQVVGAPTVHVRIPLGCCETAATGPYW